MANFALTPVGILLGRQSTGHCAICEVPFYSERDMRGHLTSIAHEEAVQAERAAEQERLQRLAFLHEVDDPEVTEHLLKVGKKMLAEGRWTVKPNERAGFS